MSSEIDKANAVPPRPAKVDWAKAAYPNITRPQVLADCQPQAMLNILDVVLCKSTDKYCHRQYEQEFFVRLLRLVNICKS